MNSAVLPCSFVNGGGQLNNSLEEERVHKYPHPQ